MSTYQPYTDFSAQSKTVHALMNLYAQLEGHSDFESEITPLVVFSAFSIESYLNSIGARKIKIWDELEMLSWKKKVIVLHKTAGKDPDWGRDPLQFADELFKIRDRLAHGKPERVLGPLFHDRRTAHEYLKKNSMEPEWYTSLTKEWAVNAKERFQILMTYLADLFDLHASDHLVLGSGGLLIDDEADV